MAATSDQRYGSVLPEGSNRIRLTPAPLRLPPNGL